MTAGETSSAISARGLTRRFPGVVALNAVDFDVRPGEVHALVGENGAGKSTLIKVIAGVDQADEGHISIFGVRADGQNATERRAAGIAAIYQELTIVPAMSAAANVFLDSPLHTAFFLRRHDMRRAFLDLCARLGVAIEPNRRAGELSISDQQMLEIMRALIAEHRVIVMDEPTASLGPVERTKLFEVIAELRRQGTAIIYVSHDLDEVLRIADRVSVMRNGRLVASDDKAEWTKDRMFQAMLGRSQRPASADRALPSAASVLTVEGLCVGRRVSDVSFSLRRGEILGIAGLVGSGRTEILRAIAGAERTASGRLTTGSEILNLPGSVRAHLRQGIALVPEDRKGQGLVALLPGTSNVVMTNLGSVATLGFVSSDRSQKLAEEATEPLAFDRQRLPYPARTLSGGNQQKLVVGKWLHRHPTVLLLDEPTRGIDIGAKAELYSVIRRLAEGGLSVILVSSELEEVIEHSDRVMVLSRGKLISVLDRDEATMNRVLGLIFAVEGQAA